MSKQDKRHKTHLTRPRLVPPGADEKEGARKSGSRSLLPVFSGLALLLFLGVCVIWFLPALSLKQSAEKKPAPASHDAAQQETSRSAPVLSDENDLEAHRLLDSWYSLQALLEAENVSVWAGEEYRQAVLLARECDELLGQGDSAGAVQSCRRASVLLKELEETKEKRFSAALESGFLALDEGDSLKAHQAFARALAIHPDSEQAQRGMQRAESLDEVITFLQDGLEKEKAGNADGAFTAYKQAVERDPDYQPSRDSLIRLQSKMDEQRYHHSMSRALSYLGKGEFGKAGTALQEARILKPDDAGVRDLQKQIARQELAARLDQLRAQVKGYEKKEQWQQAVTACSKALDLAPDAGFAVSCKDRAQRRLELDRRLQAMLSSPERLFSKGPLNEAGQLHRFALTVSDPGPRLHSQISRLSAMIELAQSEVEVMLLSDGLTEVTIFHVGRLGRFHQKRVVLRTGNYTATGSREGYRDVRQILKVRPGGEMTFTLLCKEPI